MTSPADAPKPIEAPLRNTTSGLILGSLPWIVFSGMPSDHGRWMYVAQMVSGILAMWALIRSSGERRDARSNFWFGAFVASTLSEALLSWAGP